MSSYTQFPYLIEYKKKSDSGEITLGRWMKLNLEYVERGLKEGRFFYDSEKAEKKIRFIENQINFVEGRSGLFKLELWQKYFVASMFGLVDEDGLRHFQEFVLIVARKQGKSVLAGAIETTIAFTVPEAGMQLYNIAPKLDQANIIYEKQFLQMVSKNKLLSKMGRKRKSDFYIDKTNSYVRPLAFNSKKSDGFNPYFACFDEFAAWPGVQGTNMYNVMQSATGARDEPVSIACSTANFIDNGLYDTLFPRCTNVLLGNSSEESLLPFIYMIDDAEKWDDVQELKKAMPNLGVSFKEKNLLKEIAKAHESRDYRREFITKYCNIKQSLSAAWLENAWIQSTQCEPLKPQDYSQLAGVGGVDLSQTTDLTAACIVIEKGGIHYILSHFWLPAGRIKELSERDHIDYGLMVSYGFLSLSGDKFVEYQDVTEWFLVMRNVYRINIVAIGYDRYSSTYFVSEMRNNGFLMDDVNQGTNLTPMIDEFEGLIADGKVRTGNNGLLQTHMKNSAVMHVAGDKRVRLVKISPELHIDGMAAVTDALAVRSKYKDKYQWILDANNKGIEQAVLDSLDDDLDELFTIDESEGIQWDG